MLHQFQLNPTFNFQGWAHNPPSGGSSVLRNPADGPRYKAWLPPEADRAFFSCIGHMLPCPPPGGFSKSADVIYVGQTEDLDKRISQHNGSTKFKNWTHRHKPWEILHFETFETRREAIIRERQLKSGQGRKFLRSLIPPLVPPEPNI